MSLSLAHFILLDFSYIFIFGNIRYLFSFNFSFIFLLRTLHKCSGFLSRLQLALRVPMPNTSCFDFDKCVATRESQSRGSLIRKQQQISQQLMLVSNSLHRRLKSLRIWTEAKIFKQKTPFGAKIYQDICPRKLSFPRRTVFRVRELRGTDNVQEQISESIFAPNGGYCVYYPLFSATKVVLTIGEYLTIRPIASIRPRPHGLLTRGP